MELGGQKGELYSYALHSMLIIDPRGRDVPLHLQQEESSYFTTQQEEGKISNCPATAQPMKDLSRLSQ